MAQIDQPDLIETTFNRWIVAVLGSGTNVGPKEGPESDPNPGQKHLDQLLKVMESYMNPANAGSLDLRSSIQTSHFIYKLTKAFVTRVHRERHAKKQVGTPNDYLFVQLGKSIPCYNVCSPGLTSVRPLLWQAKQTVTALCQLQPAT